MKRMLMLLMSLVFLAGCAIIPPEADIENTIENGGAYKEEVSGSVKDIEGEISEGEDNTSEGNIVLSEDEDLNEDSDEEMKIKDDDHLKILSTHHLKGESLSLQDDLDKIIDYTHELGGYVNSNNIINEGNSMKAEVALKVPRDRAGELVDEIDATISVVEENLTSVDITDKYYDIDSRIKNLEIREDRLRELYNNSDDVEEIIIIDDKLFEVTEEKEEVIQEQIKIRDKVAFSRVDLELEEVDNYSNVKKEELTASQQVKKAFSSSGSMIKKGLVVLVTVIINVFPIAVLAAGIYIGYRKIRNRYDKDKGKDNKDNDKKEIE